MRRSTPTLWWRLGTTITTTRTPFGPQQLLQICFGALPITFRYDLFQTHLHAGRDTFVTRFVPFIAFGTIFNNTLYLCMYGGIFLFQIFNQHASKQQERFLLFFHGRFALRQHRCTGWWWCRITTIIIIIIRTTGGLLGRHASLLLLLLCTRGIWISVGRWKGIRRGRSREARVLRWRLGTAATTTPIGGLWKSSQMWRRIIAAARLLLLLSASSWIVGRRRSMLLLLLLLLRLL